eukprot:8651645-Karenia_brevis.AAC.1
MEEHLRNTSARMVSSGVSVLIDKIHETLKGFHSTYGGAIFNVPHNLTSIQIASGLPPSGLGGSVDLTRLVCGSTLTWLLNPHVLHKEEKDWPPT